MIIATIIVKAIITGIVVDIIMIRVFVELRLDWAKIKYIYSYQWYK